MLEHNKFYLGDCIELMNEIPDNSIDFILCDLPYGVTARNKWDVVIPFDQLWEQYKRIVKPNAAIVLTATQPFASQLILSNPEWFRYDLIWEKNKITGFLNAHKMPLRRHELILVFYNKPPVYNPQKSTGHSPVNSYTRHIDGLTYGNTRLGFKGGGQTDRFPTSILKFPIVNNDSPDRIHSAQKPVELFSYLVKTYTNEGDLVLDNCAGSGTTAIACIDAKRNWICIEKDEECFKLGSERVQKRLEKVG